MQLGAISGSPVKAVLLVVLQVHLLTVCFSTFDVSPNLSNRIDSFDHAGWCSRLDVLTRQVKQSESSARKTLLLSKLVAFIHKRISNNAQDDASLWVEHDCNATSWISYIDVLPWPSCETGRAALTSCPGLRSCIGNATHLPRVAIIMGSTSRGIAEPSILNMPLFTRSLPSIAKTVECGFQYTVYVGYDAGDSFFDAGNGRGLQAVQAWFDRNVHASLHRRGIDIRIKLVRFDNVLNKPGPVFNAVARAAHSDGVDFYYRVNDDTTLITTAWASKMACALCSLGPPFGVVGPLSTHRSDILEHDFVHSTHMAIFQSYYAEELVDWWMDDWISRVYGSARSVMLVDVKTAHNAFEDNRRRYQVDVDNEKKLIPLLQKGRQKLRRYVKNRISRTVFDLFSGNTFDFVQQI